MKYKAQKCCESEAAILFFSKNLKINNKITGLGDVPTLNLRPGMNAAAFSTYIINFSEFKLVSFMAYTYNMNMTQLKIQNGDLTFEVNL